MFSLTVRHVLGNAHRLRLDLDAGAPCGDACVAGEAAYVGAGERDPLVDVAGLGSFAKCVEGGGHEVLVGAFACSVGYLEPLTSLVEGFQALGEIGHMHRVTDLTCESQFRKRKLLP